MSTNKELREGVADKAKTCFLYVRVSTKMQVENGESIEAQLYDLCDYAKRNNLRILHEYIDDGYSGKNITGRPHFQEMMEEIKSGVRVDYVLVFKLSRFGRNAADALSSLQLMQDYGTNLVCVKDGINSEAQMGKMMIAFMSAFAEMERGMADKPPMAISSSRTKRARGIWKSTKTRRKSFASYSASTPRTARALWRSHLGLMRRDTVRMSAGTASTSTLSRRF